MHASIKKIGLFTSGLFLSALITQSAFALPAFAVRENVSCTRCHTNGSAPHLTKAGYMYRRAGFRFPEEIGVIEKTSEKRDIPRFFSAGANLDYQLTTSKPNGQTKASVTNNEFNVREVEIWPMVGSFAGNYGIWTELDLTPEVVGSAASSAINQADMRYVRGTAEHFFNFRAGLIAPEGYGASDQWLDDGNIPLMDTQTAQFNGVDTLATPMGALQSAQMGAEFGYNYFDTHATVGLYNGFDGTNGLNSTPAIQSTLVRGLTNPHARGSKDLKFQLDQFLAGDKVAFTAVYYSGKISLLDPTNTNVWVDHYSMMRLYGTFSVMPTVVDILAGVGQGKNDKFDTTLNKASGDYKNRGAFLGAMYYALPHLSLAARMDYYNYAYKAAASAANPRSVAYTLMASLPYENNIYSFHFNRTLSDVDPAGVTNDFRAEWRVLF